MYSKFYTASPNYINLYITYLDTSNNIIHIKNSLELNLRFLLYKLSITGLRLSGNSGNSV